MPSRNGEQKPRHEPRGWAGRNPESYHGLAAAFNFMATLTGSILIGHLMAESSGREWIMWVAIVWGFGGGLWILMRRMKQIEEKYGKTREDKKDAGDS